MWIANIDRIEPRDQVRYAGLNAYLVPIENRKFSVHPGDNLIIGERGNGVVGYGKILSAPLRLSTIPKDHRKNVVHESLLHVYISTVMIMHIGAIFPWSVFSQLPIERNCKQPLVIGNKYFYLVGHHVFSCVMYLLGGTLHNESIFDSMSDLLGTQINLRRKIYRRLHFIHDTGKSWLLAKKYTDAARSNSILVCEICGITAPIDDPSFFQLHYVGSMEPHAPYLKYDFQVLCPNCHAVANFEFETAAKLS